MGGVCGIPRATRGARGLVVDGVYRRLPPSGGRELPGEPRNYRDSGQLVAGAGAHLKGEPRAQTGGTKVDARWRRPSCNRCTRVSRRP